MKAFLLLLRITCLLVAAWMIWDTHHTFPNAPFAELIPGYIIFPVLILLVGVCCGLVAKDIQRAEREAAREPQ